MTERAARLLDRAGFLVERETEPNTIRVGDLEIDRARYEVSRAGRAVRLTATEFRLLVALAERPRIVQEPHELLSRAWGPEYREDAGYLRPIVSRLRRKLGDDPRRPAVIETVRGVGYRLCADG